MRRSTPILALILLGACFQVPDPNAQTDRCKRMCDRADQCENLEGGEECVDQCVSQQLGDSCVEAYEAADCASLELGLASTGSWVDICYPRCKTDTTACQGSSLLTCAQGRFVKEDCNYSCERAGLAFSGVCAKERAGQPSPTGLDYCFCDPK